LLILLSPFLLVLYSPHFGTFSVISLGRLRFQAKISCSGSECSRELKVSVAIQRLTGGGGFIDLEKKQMVSEVLVFARDFSKLETV